MKKSQSYKESKWVKPKDCSGSCVWDNPVSAVYRMCTGENQEWKWSLSQGLRILCPPSSKYPCRFPAIFAERFPESDIKPTSFCLTAFDGGESINLSEPICNSFMLSASMASCKQWVPQCNYRLPEEILPSVCSGPADHFMMCLYRKK